MHGDRHWLMKYSWAVTAVVSLAVGLMVGGFLTYLAATVGVIALIFAPPRWKVALLIIASQLAIDVGTIRGVSDVLLVEVIGIPFLVLAVIDALRRRKPLIPRGARLTTVVVAVFAALAVAHASGLLGVVGSIGDTTAPVTNSRAYYDLFVGICVFLAALYFADAEEEWTDGPLLTIAILGVGVGALRAGAYYTGIAMPAFLGGRFQYDVVTTVSGVAAARIGGLTEAASFAIGGGIGLLQRGRLRGFATLAILAGIVFAMVSGGRSYAIGAVAGLLIYFTTLPQRKLWLRLAAFAVAGVGTAVVIAAVGLGSQLTRLSALAGGIEAQDPYRYKAMNFMWLEFLAHPIFGKGIGAGGTGLVEQFVTEVVALGGHSTYVAVLANFGVIGLAENVAVIGHAIVRSWRALRAQAVDASSPATGWLAMILFVLVTRVVEYTVGGNGYSDYAMYAMAASAIAIHLVTAKSEAADA